MRLVRCWLLMTGLLGTAVAGAQMNGDWYCDGQANTMEHLRIVGAMVQAWAVCRPAACDWGAARGSLDGGYLVVTHDVTGVHNTMKMRLMPGDASRLEVEDFTVYMDDSRRPARSYSYVFVRTPPGRRARD